MDWDNVRVFLAVARGGQFVAAAKRLKLDHATVSRRIAALEETVGAKLFDRRTTGAKLTGAGERFISAAEQMESAFLHAQGEIWASISNSRAMFASARRTGSRPIISWARCATSPSVIPPCACN
jgi:molybdate transport repressor ModE-like protein